VEKEAPLKLFVNNLVEKKVPLNRLGTIWWKKKLRQSV
jgi:hypothetical protein